MNETDYNKLLYEKMKTEQDKFREWLFTQEPSEILNHTYEYTMREDIVMCMEELELSQKQAKALYKSPCPLRDVYEEFKDREVEHMDTIRDSEKPRTTARNTSPGMSYLPRTASINRTARSPEPM